MSFTESTPFLHLPQYQAEDTLSVLVDFNNAMEAIDAGVKANYDSGVTATQDSSTALTKVTDVESKVTTNSGDIAALDVRVTALEGGGGGGTTPSEEIEQIKKDTATALCQSNTAIQKTVTMQSDITALTTQVEVAKTSAENAQTTADSAIDMFEGLDDRIAKVEEEAGKPATIPSDVVRAVTFGPYKPVEGADSKNFSLTSGTCTALFGQGILLPNGDYQLNVTVSLNGIFRDMNTSQWSSVTVSGETMYPICEADGNVFNLPADISNRVNYILYGTGFSGTSAVSLKPVRADCFYDSSTDKTYIAVVTTSTSSLVGANILSPISIVLAGGEIP